MSFDIPSFLTPVMWYYGLNNHWPGLDEDKIVEWGEKSVAELEATEAMAKAIYQCLQDLGQVTEVEFVEAIGTGVEDVHKDIDQWLNMLKVGIPLATNGAAIAITGYKTTIVGILTYNVAADIPLICSGVGLFVIAAKKAIMRELLDVLLTEAKGFVLNELLDIATKYIETYWLGPAKDEFNKFLREALSGMQVLEPGSSSSGGAKVQIAFTDVMECVTRINLAASSFKQAWEDADADPDFTDDSIGGADVLVKEALQDLLKWGKGQLQTFMIETVIELIDILCDMLNTSYEKMEEADKKVFQAAQELIKGLETTRPTGVAASDEAPPDFFAAARATLGAGSADSDETPGATVRPTVTPTRPTGSATANPTDISVLDASPTDAKGAGTAQSDEEAPHDSGVDGSPTDVKGAGTAQSDEGAPHMDVSVLDV